MRRAVFRVQPAERARKVVVDAGDEREARRCGEPDADAAQRVQHDEDGGDRSEPVETDAATRGDDRVHDAAEPGNLRLGQREQDGQRAQDVDQR